MSLLVIELMEVQNLDMSPSALGFPGNNIKNI
jgi:hypothetical protein